MTGENEQTIVKNQKDIEAYAQLLVRELSKVVEFGGRHGPVNYQAICDSYVDSLVYMLMPRSIAVKQAAIYKRREHADVHLDVEAVAKADAELAELKQDFDLIEVRLMAIELLRSKMTDQAMIAIFDQHLMTPEKPALAVHEKARPVGQRAITTVNDFQPAFAT